MESDGMNVDPRKFTQYAVYYGPDDYQTGIKGLKADAPEEAWSEYIKWLQDRNRYENGRARSAKAIEKMFGLNSEVE